MWIRNQCYAEACFYRPIVLFIFIDMTENRAGDIKYFLLTWGATTENKREALHYRKWQNTRLRSASFVLDWTAYTHHALLLRLYFPPVIIPFICFHYAVAQQLNRWLCTLRLQYGSIDLDSNSVPLCRRRHLESWLETSQTTCSQFASHSRRTLFP